jgi:hypothetical protein
LEWFAQAAERHALWLLFAALVLVAALVSRFSRDRRHKIRRVFILYVLAVAAEFAARALGSAKLLLWHDRLEFSGHLLESFVVINLVAIAIFDVITPALAFSVPIIASDLISGCAYVVATLGSLNSAGVDPTSVLGASAVVSAVLALSLQSTLGNVIGGVALQLDGSVKVGDWVQLENGRQGKVREIRWRHCVLETRDWGTLIVPNSSLLQSQILVLGKREGQPRQHRLWVYFNVDFRFAPSRVVAVVNEALQASAIPNVALDPRPHAIVMDLSRDGKESFGYYAVRYWLTDLAVDDPTSSLVRQRIYMALKRAGIPLARPTSSSVFMTEEPPAARLARHRETRVKALSDLALFAPLTDDERASIAEHLIFAPFAAGELVTRAGNVAHWLYILIAGEVDIQLREGDDTKLLSTITAPGYFGEMGMMTGAPRAADVIARTDVECYRLDKSGFQQILAARPELAKDMSRTMAKRRAELKAAREGMADDLRDSFAEEEQVRILHSVEAFFGLR